jgi:hypothetical protein
MGLPKLVLIFFLQVVILTLNIFSAPPINIFFENWALYFFIVLSLISYPVHMIWLERFGDLTLTWVCWCFIFLELFLLINFFFFHHFTFGLLGIKHCYFIYLFSMRLSGPHNLSREFAMITWVDCRFFFLLFFFNFII